MHTPHTGTHFFPLIHPLPYFKITMFDFEMRTGFRVGVKIKKKSASRAELCIFFGRFLF